MAAASGYYRPGASWLHRRNPVTKLLALLLVIITAFLLPPPVLPVLLALLVVLAALCHVLGAVMRTLRIPALLLLSILLVNAFFFPGATNRIIGIGPFWVTGEGLAFGLNAAGRLIVAFVASVLFLLTTLADDLLEALISRGVSHRMSFVVLTAVQMVPRLQERATSILEAQQARGLAISGSFLVRLRALLPLVGPVLLGSLIDVRERTFALEARGFGALPKRTAYRRVVDPTLDRVLRPLLLLAIVGVVGLAILGLPRL
jgi:energy-coupling factor transport system permease protein